MDGAFVGNADVAVKPSDQELADLASTPMGLLPLDRDDQGFELGCQLVGIAHRPPAAVGQRLEPLLLVPIEDFVAGL